MGVKQTHSHVLSHYVTASPLGKRASPAENILQTLALWLQTRDRGYFLRVVTDLVGQEQAGHGLSVGQGELAVQVLLPPLTVAESGGVGNVKHNDTG